MFCNLNNVFRVICTHLCECVCVWGVGKGWVVVGGRHSTLELLIMWEDFILPLSLLLSGSSTLIAAYITINRNHDRSPITNIQAHMPVYIFNLQTGFRSNHIDSYNYFSCCHCTLYLSYRSVNRR